MTDESDHGVDGCSMPERYRCVVCWAAVCWCKGAADDVDEVVSKALTPIYRDTKPRRRQTPKISDAGICDCCWNQLGGGELAAVEVEDWIDL